MTRRWFTSIIVVLLGLGIAAAAGLALAAALAYPNLPSLEALTEYRPKIPLRIYTADGALIGEFGEERRALIAIAQVPKPLIQAILAAEDERFYQHGGVDYLGVLRAAWSNFYSGGARQGASTITMQVARNFYLSREKTLYRKFNEALLAFKIEKNLSKDRILEIYINQIYLGQRAYGFGAAALAYFGKPLSQLNVAEFAMLAGLPKAPSRFNPVVNPKRAKMRQEYVLRRMRELGYIDDKQYAQAKGNALAVRREFREYEVHGQYVAEMARQMVVEQYQEEAYSRGFRVYTTVRARDQEAAHAALRRGVLDYDRRHGYRGPEGFLDISGEAASSEEALDDALQEAESTEDLYPAVVLEVSTERMKVYRRGGETLTLGAEDIKLGAKSLGDKAPPASRIRRGSIVRVAKNEKGTWQLAQLPQVEAALVSLDPEDGAILSLSGGFDFDRNKFNHVTQAWRQPGSSFKPFIYSAALEKGFTTATIINDAPILISAEETGSQPWEPKNYDGTFSGPMRLRAALAKSKNLVSIRILQAIGPRYAQDYVTRFGFDADKHPAYLTMALGAGSATPLQMVGAYAVIANGGYRVAPYFIRSIHDNAGTVLAQANPARAGESAERVIDERNSFIMYTLLQDVVRQGTATRALQLKRGDLAGKTGTTNDQRDAWFTGFQKHLVAVAWIGFDRPQSLGNGETGARAALPIWMSYMGVALKGIPEEVPEPPEGVVVARIDPDSGLRLDGGDSGLVDYFYRENLPAPAQDTLLTHVPGEAKPSEQVKDQIF